MKIRSRLIMPALGYGFVTDALCLISRPIALQSSTRSWHSVASLHIPITSRTSMLRCISSGKDAGYSFEDYALKRSTFEPNLQSYLSKQGAPWPNYYSNHGIMRGGKIPDSGPEFHAVLKDSSSRFILTWRGRNVFRQRDAMYEAVKLSAQQCAEYINDPRSVIIHLGVDSGIRYFALDVSHLSQISEAEEYVLEQLRSMGGLIDDDRDAGTLAFARGMSVWHRSEKYCSNCGSADLVSVKFGASKVCLSCKQQFYPRIDPSMIALITARGGEYGLFGRKSVWPVGRYSLLSGFAEVGEALEETVVREVWEESGVRVREDSIRFCSSQTWPFPRSLMIGFIGEAVEEGSGLPRIEIDVEEMDDVRWVSREELRRGLAAAAGDKTGAASAVEPLSIPGRAAIAHRIIMEWLTASK